MKGSDINRIVNRIKWSTLLSEEQKDALGFDQSVSTSFFLSFSFFLGGGGVVGGEDVICIHDY